MMRILACFFVIFNHTGARGFFLFSQRPWGGLPFWCYLWLSVFCKFSVPLFFMISGVLLIPREKESLGYLYKNRILKIVCTLFIFSALCYLREIQLGRQTFDVGTFFIRFYEKNWNYSYWYLYAYIAFLITLPILRPLAKNLKDEHYFYLIGLYIVFVSLLPIFQYFLWKGQHKLNRKLSIGWVTTNIVFYPLMGYFLQYRIKDIKKGKTIVLMWIMNTLAICVSCYMTYLRAIDMGKCAEGVSQAFHSSFAALNAITIFLTVKYIYLRYGKTFPSWLNKIVASGWICNIWDLSFASVGIEQVEKHL